MKKALLALAMLLSAESIAAEISTEGKGKYPKEAIVQAVIDHKQLQPYLHPELPARVPLKVSDLLIGRNLNLTKFGKKVEIVSDKSVSGAYLRFTAFSCNNGNYCNLAFQYPIEGLSGVTGVFINRDGSLKFEKTEISEK